MAYSIYLLLLTEQAVHAPIQSPWDRCASSAAGAISRSCVFSGFPGGRWQMLIFPLAANVISDGQLVFPQLKGAPQLATSPLLSIGILLQTHMGTEKVRTSVALVPVLSPIVTCMTLLPSSPDSSNSIAPRCRVCRKASCRRISVSVVDQADCPAKSAEYMPTRITAKISVVTSNSTIVKPCVCFIVRCPYTPGVSPGA